MSRTKAEQGVYAWLSATLTATLPTVWSIAFGNQNMPRQDPPSAVIIEGPSVMRGTPSYEVSDTDGATAGTFETTRGALVEGVTAVTLYTGEPGSSSNNAFEEAMKLQLSIGDTEHMASNSGDITIYRVGDATPAIQQNSAGYARAASVQVFWRYVYELTQDQYAITNPSFE